MALEDDEELLEVLGIVVPVRAHGINIIGELVFNQTVTLRDTWAKVQQGEG